GQVNRRLLCGRRPRAALRGSADPTLLHILRGLRDVAITAEPRIEERHRLRGLLLLLTYALHATAAAAGIVARPLLRHLDHPALALDRRDHLGVVAVDVLAHHQLAVLDAGGLVGQMHRNVSGEL